MTHIITVTVESEADREAVIDDIRYTLEYVVEGVIGDPDQHPIYGGQLVSVE